jgi:CDP-glucose 4,6-dehydratase
VEGLGMSLFGDTYRGRKVLVTGHTGFKGSWLSAWLYKLGANVIGLGLDPVTSPSHWDLLRLNVDDRRIDIRNAAAVAKVIRDAAPECVFHLAAQPLVRRSYADPLETWSANVMGTANVLEACRKQPSVRAIVSITSDKCYENREWDWSYRENDQLGGHDPYSASKAGAELVISSYRSAFFHEPGAPFLASARAGNVIGGGDWSQDRLIPDLVRAVAHHHFLEIRSPDATRPWQHVLESLSGYLCLGQKLLDGQAEFAQAWNFGPEAEGNRRVCDLLVRIKATWPVLDWRVTTSSKPHEATKLYLDSVKARQRLGWQSVWSFDQSIDATVEWYRAHLEHGERITERQLCDYIADAKRADLAWSREE